MTSVPDRLLDFLVRLRMINILIFHLSVCLLFTFSLCLLDFHFLSVCLSVCSVYILTLSGRFSFSACLSVKTSFLSVIFSFFVWLSVCLSCVLCLFAYLLDFHFLSICLSVSLSIYLSLIFLSVCLSVLFNSCMIVNYIFSFSALLSSISYDVLFGLSFSSFVC